MNKNQSRVDYMISDFLKKNFKKVFNFIRSFLILIYYFIFLYLFLFMFFSLFISRENIIKFFHFNYFIVASESMQDKFEVGDCVIVKKISDKGRQNLKKSSSLESKDGDVIIFNVDNEKFPNSDLSQKIIIHRVVDNKIVEKYVTTKGDNNSDILIFEKKIPYKNILAKPILKISYKHVFWIKCIMFIIASYLLICLLIDIVKIVLKSC
ncbi:S26 family signal peptidase [Candidatus Phytoplasma sacchari]|uniref:S26 family signal peptidase n=1 Tax=Candidatus Phytoplasma sacchari TaxID=2609813 RepID=A0ABY7M3A7_9MOLU|nr:S26 family signal peptidase [Candidatus Phytoplasma sacchari]